MRQPVCALHEQLMCVPNCLCDKGMSKLIDQLSHRMFCSAPQRVLADAALVLPIEGGKADRTDCKGVLCAGSVEAGTVWQLYAEGTVMQDWFSPVCMHFKPTGCINAAACQPYDVLHVLQRLLWQWTASARVAQAAGGMLIGALSS